MKKQFTLHLVFIFTLALLNLTADDTHLKIPVRVYLNGVIQKDLKINNFILKINGKTRPITDCIRQSNKIEKTRGPKNFVLIFNLDMYGEDYTAAINHLVKNIIQENDHIILWSPDNRINLLKKKQNKIDMINEIIEKVKKGARTKRADMDGRIKEIKNNVSRFQQSIRGSTLNFQLARMSSFIGDFVKQWQEYRNRFLLPDPRSYYRLAGSMAGNNRENIFINFQQSNIMPDIASIKTQIKNLKNILSDVPVEKAATASRVKSGAMQIDRLFYFSEENYPLKALKLALAADNISYNVLFFHNIYKHLTGLDDYSADIKKMLARLANQTGGILADTQDLVGGLSKIQQREDIYYNIIFKYDGKIENKNVEIKLTGTKGKAFYKPMFLKGEIEFLTKVISMPQIKIENFNCINHRLMFMISNYVIHPDKKMGYIDARIQILDDKNKQVFQTGNVLKSKHKSVNIRGIPLPAKIKGYYKIVLTATDLISKKTARISKYIKL